jgi:acetyl esterase/lipase
VPEAREYQDSLLLAAPAAARVDISTPAGAPVRGRWFTPREQTGRTLLYFHGGGYATSSKAYDNFVALLAEATGARTFALDYRLTPEHPHPAQLEDALAAYAWLLDSGVQPGRLALGGDSAGGHLVLTTLVALRDAGRPLPALGLGLCPWTDARNRGASLMGNNRYDWIQGEHALQFGEWYRGSLPIDDPRLSPVLADLRGLPPLVLQAGGREILHDMIVEFAAEARRQEVDVTLQVWPDMIHDFQAFGPEIPEAAEALAALRAAMAARCG